MNKTKKKIFVSFSAGETSGFMVNWLLNNKSNEFEMIFIFANAGEENEATLKFADQVDKYYGLNLVWIEYDLINGKSGFKQVDFKTAYRSHDSKEIENGFQNSPFTKMISKYGIPNVQSIHCTRELKERPMQRYLRSIGWKANSYDIAIGIRADEIDRIGSHYYPLVPLGIIKPMVNYFWKKMPFRLELKGYEGNCKTCWKKALRKLSTIMIENPDWYLFNRQMEKDYGDYVSPGRQHNKSIQPPIRFFRENRTCDDIFSIAIMPGFEKALDDSLNTIYQTSILHDGSELDISNGCTESCEIFAAQKD